MSNIIQQYFVIEIGEFYKRPLRMRILKNEIGDKWYTFPGTPEWNCLEAMLKGKDVRLIQKDEKAYDFCIVLWKAMEAEGGI